MATVVKSASNILEKIDEQTKGVSLHDMRPKPLPRTKPAPEGMSNNGVPLHYTESGSPVSQVNPTIHPTEAKASDDELRNAAASLTADNAKLVRKITQFEDDNKSDEIISNINKHIRNPPTTPKSKAEVLATTGQYEHSNAVVNSEQAADEAMSSSGSPMSKDSSAVPDHYQAKSPATRNGVPMQTNQNIHPDERKTSDDELRNAAQSATGGTRDKPHEPGTDAENQGEQQPQMAAKDAENRPIGPKADPVMAPEAVSKDGSGVPDHYQPSEEKSQTNQNIHRDERKSSDDELRNAANSITAPDGPDKAHEAGTALDNQGEQHTDPDSVNTAHRQHSAIQRNHY
jgi:hypothetical protein